MLDWEVVLTPILALGVLLLLGYVGCDLASAAIGDPPIDPVFSSPGFYIVVRVPTALKVTIIRYIFTPPTPEMPEWKVTVTNPVAAEKDGTYSYYTYNCGAAIGGTWIAGCAVEASDNGITQASGDTDDTVNSDGSQRLKANFWTTGAPSRGDFEVHFKGSEEL